jgi:hypothetical protein
MVVLPIPATAIQIKTLDAEEVPFPQVEEFCRRLSDQIAKQWELRGFKVAQSKLGAGNRGTITNGFQDKDVWMQVQLRRAYETLARVNGQVRGEVTRPEAPLLAEYEGADGLVFVGAFVVTESPGAAGTRRACNALTALVGVGLLLSGSSVGGLAFEGSPEGCSLEVILVEGRTGEVLWRSLVTSKSLDGPLLDTVVQKVFARYPKK